MDYQLHYDSLIESRRSLGRDKTNGYFESHHIVPRCLGGLDNAENLILLTAKEHFIAHLLLTKIYPENTSLGYAFFRMATPAPNHSRQKSISYEKRRFLASKLSKKMWEDEKFREKMKLSKQYMQTEEYRSVMSAATSGEKNGMFGKNHSEESRKKMSENTDSEFYSEMLANNWANPEFRQSRISSMVGVKKQEQKCPHCGKIGRGGNMKRYHFDLCKEKR